MALRLLSDLAGTLLTAFRVGRATLSSSGLSAARTVTLPDKSGTVAMLDDVGGGSAVPEKVRALLDSAARAFNNNPRVRGLLVDPPTVTVGTGTAPSLHTRTFTFGTAPSPFVSNGGRPTTSAGRTTFPVVTPSGTRIDFAWRVETIVDGDSVAFLLDSVTANGYRFIVDGQYVSATTTVSSAGSERYYQLEWPTKAKRRVVVEGNTNLGFWGAAVKDEDGCFMPPDTDALRLFVVGDSDLFMQDFQPKGDSYGFVLGDFLGARDTWCNGISSTGFVVNGGGNNYNTRADDWNTLTADSIDLLAVQMSFNDYNASVADATLKAAIAELIADARAAHPNAVIILFGCASWNDTSTAAGLAEDEELALEAIDEANDPLVGFVPVYTQTASYRPTYGNTASGDTGTGNTPRYVSHSSDHMTPAGNAHYGEWLARRFIEVLAGMAGVPTPTPLPKQAPVEAGGGGSGTGFDYVQSSEPGGAVDGELLLRTDINPLDRANHAGTQAATTVTLTGPALVGRTAGTAGAAAAIPLGNGLEFVGGALKGNKIPPRVNNATSNLLASDIGACVVKNNTTAYTWTLQSDSDYVAEYPTLADIQGTCMLLVNDGGSGNLTIARDTGIALLNGTSDANLTVGPGQAVTIQHMPTANRWRVL